MTTLVFFRFYHSGKIAGGTLHSASRPARSAMAWDGVVSAVSTTSARPGPFKDLAAAAVGVALLFVDGAVRIEADSDVVGLGDPEGLRVNPCVSHAQLSGMPLAPFRRARAGGELGSVLWRMTRSRRAWPARMHAESAAMAAGRASIVHGEVVFGRVRVRVWCGRADVWRAPAVLGGATMLRARGLRGWCTCGCGCECGGNLRARGGFAAGRTGQPPLFPLPGAQAANAQPQTTAPARGCGRRAHGGARRMPRQMSRRLARARPVHPAAAARGRGRLAVPAPSDQAGRRPPRWARDAAERLRTASLARRRAPARASRVSQAWPAAGVAGREPIHTNRAGYICTRISSPRHSAPSRGPSCRPANRHGFLTPLSA
jgi:hypothetical protein